jgi:hypothetical protein
MKDVTKNKAAKLCIAAVSLLGASQAAIAHADCSDDLVEAAFAHHEADPSIDSKVAMQAWLCEGKSDAFLAAQPAASLPTNKDDQARWDALLHKIDSDTVIGTTPTSSAVTTFRSSNNCAHPSKNQLIHALGRVTTATEFETYHACDAAAVHLDNSTSGNYDLDLSCSGQQLPDGKLEFSVRGFSAQDANAVGPLGNLQFSLQNLTAVPGNPTAIASGANGVFLFSVTSPTQDASIGMSGSVATDFGDSVSYFCDLDFGATASSSRPYGLPPEVDCAFDPPQLGTTVCPAGKLQQACVDGHWQDTSTCIADKVDLTVFTQNQSGGTGSVQLPDGSTCTGACTRQFDKLSEQRLRAFPGANTNLIWSGCSRLEGNDCIVKLNSTSNFATATFQGQARLNLNVVGNGAGSVTMPNGTLCYLGTGTCTNYLTPGTTLTLNANPSGFTHVYWSGCSPSSNQTQCTLTANGTNNVTVTINELVVITAKRVSGTGSGGGITFPSGQLCDLGSCLELVDKGSVAKLTAHPNTGSKAVWSSCSSVSGNVCSVNMGASMTVSLTYTKVVTHPPRCPDLAMKTLKMAPIGDVGALPIQPIPPECP